MKRENYNDGDYFDICQKNRIYCTYVLSVKKKQFLSPILVILSTEQISQNVSFN